MAQMSRIIMKGSESVMKKYMKSLLLVGLSTVLVASGMAQAQKTSTSTTSKMKVAKSPSAPAKKLSELSKVYGVVVRDGVKAGIVTIGMPRQGRVNVDTNTAKVVTKDGKTFNVRNLTPGSNITAVGKMGGQTFKATEVKVNYVREPGAIKKKIKPTAAGLSQIEPKAKAKTTRKSG